MRLEKKMLDHGQKQKWSKFRETDKNGKWSKFGETEGVQN